LFTKEKKHTLGEVKMHSTKLLNVGTKKNKIIMNCIIFHRKWNSMLDLQVVNLASNKENLSPTPNAPKKG
jgi:hypothetical protein